MTRPLTVGEVEKRLAADNREIGWMVRILKAESCIAAEVAKVDEARVLCPFSGIHRGPRASSDEPCKVCHQKRNGDGGTCVIVEVEHMAIEEIRKWVK